MALWASSAYFLPAPNGSRYPLGVGGWIRPRNGIPRKPSKCSKNAARTPSRVHALLGVFLPIYPLCELDNLI